MVINAGRVGKPARGERDRQTDSDRYSGEGESAFRGIVKSKTGAEMPQIHAERALVPSNILMELVKSCTTTRNQVYV